MIMHQFKIIGVLVSLFALVWHTLCGTSQINPANYIWINYGAHVPVLQKSQLQFGTSIPCEARIGKCSYKYNILPAGWVSKNDGTLLIPATDALRDGAFTITGQLSEVTGQKINVNLIAQISKGYLTVADSADFYSRTGYKNKQKTIQPLQTKYQQSPLVKDLPDGFPLLQQIYGQIVLNPIEDFPQYINKLFERYAPCRSKINYFTNVKQLIRSVIDDNKLTIQNMQRDNKDKQTMLTQLKLKKYQMTNKESQTSSIDRAQKDKTTVIQQIANLSVQRNKNQILADQALTNLKNYDIFNFGNNQQLQQLQKQLEVQNQQINQMLAERGELQKAILQSSFDPIARSFEQGNKTVDSMRKKYDIVVDQIVQSVKKSIKNNFAISDYKQYKGEASQLLTLISKHIPQQAQKDKKSIQLKDAQAKKSQPAPETRPNSAQIEKLSKQSSVLSRNLQYLQIMRKSLTAKEKGCAN